MPELIRVTGWENTRCCIWCAVRCVPHAFMLWLISGPAAARGLRPGLRLAGFALPRRPDDYELVALTLFCGVVLFAVVAAILLMRTRDRLHSERAQAREAAVDLAAKLDRAEGLLHADPQVIISWSRGAPPDIIGDPSLAGPSLTAAEVSHYQAWLDPDQAGLLDAATARLKAEGQAFSLALSTKSGRDLWATGRPIGASAVLRLTDVSAERRQVADITRRQARQEREAETKRRLLVEAHRRTLDQLSTGVAIFDPDHKLTFYNAAYRALWEIDADFLDQHPSNSAVLDRLRARRLLTGAEGLPRLEGRVAWGAYRAADPAKYEWHLPDLRTLRVITTPNPDGGVTYLFDDVTERLDLERRYDALIRVQGETLDNLTEAVAVFGSDGRVQLFNPAFQNMWQLSPEMLAERPHIEAVIAQCRAFQNDDETWQILRAAVTAIDSRDPIFRRMERCDDSVVDCRTVRLPDGATLVTFHDVTDSVNVARALIERNAALVAADKIKHDFVQNVSYELRSPLTNIIGFAQLLGDAATGPLTPRQAEYLGHIGASSDALLAIIDNILDLASIGAGAIALDLGTVDIRAAMAAAAVGVQDRLVKDGIILEQRAAADIGSFVADERRIRQILFNLLSNAVGFSPPGGTVVLAAARTADAVIFTVSDHGTGIPGELTDKVFEPFESHPHGTHHHGAGLGLSIVRSFVDMHHGTVRIDSVPGQGTTVICSFPLTAGMAPVASSPAAMTPAAT